MKITCKVNKPAPITPRWDDFPYLALGEASLVVLITGPGIAPSYDSVSGIVIFPGYSSWKIGDKSTEWAKSYFRPLAPGESITLGVEL